MFGALSSEIHSLLNALCVWDSDSAWKILLAQFPQTKPVESANCYSSGWPTISGTTKLPRKTMKGSPHPHPAAQHSVCPFALSHSKSLQDNRVLIESPLPSRRKSLRQAGRSHRSGFRRNPERPGAGQLSGNKRLWIPSFAGMTVYGPTKILMRLPCKSLPIPHGLSRVGL